MYCLPTISCTHTPTHILSLPTVEPPLPPAEPLNGSAGSKPSSDVLDLPPDNEPPPPPSVPLPEDEPVSLLHSNYPAELSIGVM